MNRAVLKEKFLANLSALPHFGGHIILVVAGHSFDQIAGTLFLTATGAKLVWGHRDWGMQLSAALSMVGICVLFGPAMYTHDIWAIAAYLTTMAGLLYAFFGHWLDATFAASSSPVLRFLLGAPRQRLRDAFLIGKIPTVVFAILSKDWALLAAQIVYASGDFMLGASKVEAKQK